MEPASIMRAYWTSGLFGELDLEHFVVPVEGSEAACPFPPCVRGP